MAQIQRQFEQFHEAIRLKRFSENAELREKRDRVLKRLREGLQEVFAGKGKTPPEYDTFDQGSYAMGTGVKPATGDYDIDEGVVFKIATTDYPDPVTVKEWAYEALKGHTKSVEIRRSCVTVWYQEDDEDLYHVDLAIYSGGNPGGKMHLAKGKQNSEEQHRVWEEADPQGLIDGILGRFAGEDAGQFRRTIRYLKRWRDERFPSDGNAAPIGIGITVAAYHWFQPVYMVDTFSNTRRYDDLAALLRFVQTMRDNFTQRLSDGQWVERLEVRLPVAPFGSLFEKMTDAQMVEFKDKLDKLLEALEAAHDEADPVEACRMLRRQFGDDFPVPKKEDTGRRTPPAIVSSSSSA